METNIVVDISPLIPYLAKFFFSGVRSHHAQSTQKNKFTISLQYLKENVKDEVDFLPADKRQRFLQVNAIILGMCDQACPKYPK